MGHRVPSTGVSQAQGECRTLLGLPGGAGMLGGLEVTWIPGLQDPVLPPAQMWLRGSNTGSLLCRLENGDGSVSPQPKVGAALGGAGAGGVAARVASSPLSSRLTTGSELGELAGGPGGGDSQQQLCLKSPGQRYGPARRGLSPPRRLGHQSPVPPPHSALRDLQTRPLVPDHGATRQRLGAGRAALPRPPPRPGPGAHPGEGEFSRR